MVGHGFGSLCFYQLIIVNGISFRFGSSLYIVNAEEISCSPSCALILALLVQTSIHPAGASVVGRNI